jgi:threonine synthase
VERELVCQEDGRRFGLETGAWRCPCGGLLDLSPAPALDPDRATGQGPSLWRWRHTFGLDDEVTRRRVTMGEGGTPLVAIDPERPRVLGKLDFLMPTLSFKDRGAAVLVTLAAAIGAKRLVADSSGNAGTAIAAYAARAGLPCEVFVPQTASPKKLAAMRAHGAVVKTVAGSREDTAEAAMEVAERGDAFYASHVYQPAFFEGTKTFAFEVWEQLGRRTPDEVVVPAGNGTLLLGVHAGFRELQRAGLIGVVPRLVAVQAAACNPLERAWRTGAETSTPAVPAQTTVAEGIAIAAPARSRQILAAVRETGGSFVAVSEDAIAAARDELSQRGLYLEPTAAATYAGLIAHLAGQRGTPGQPEPGAPDQPGQPGAPDQPGAPGQPAPGEPGDRADRDIVWAVCGAGLKSP